MTRPYRREGVVSGFSVKIDVFKPEIRILHSSTTREGRKNRCKINPTSSLYIDMIFFGLPLNRKNEKVEKQDKEVLKCQR